MALPVFDTLDAVPEAFRGDYIAHEGKLHCRADVELAAALAKVKEHLNETKDEKRKRQAAEAALEESTRNDAARKRGITEAELQQIRDAEIAARAPLMTELQDLKTQLATARDKLTKLTHTDRVLREALEHGVLEDRADDAMHTILPRTTLTEQGTIVYLDAKGAVTTDTAAQFHEKLAKAKSWFYRGTGSVGTNGQPSTKSDPAPSSPTNRAQHHRTALQGAF